MTVPMELQQASKDFEKFLIDARDSSGLTTRNQTYTMVQGVLQTFRRRLDVREPYSSLACFLLCCGRSLLPTGTSTSRNSRSPIGRP